MRYVVGADIAVDLARRGARPGIRVHLLAPTLIRSELLSSLYRLVHDGTLTRADADRYLDHIHALRIRLLGDRVLQRNAWQVAEQLSWPDTLTAEYVALTRLQADAFVTLDAALAQAAARLVRVATVEELLEP
ncbi:type II toxin-antitoxin system VapC family toxin [Georgenia sp. 311]|uniref:Type II toxin-antitoxin system VapC family toxin n=1 Tax=Georgenia wutianyii TaxID=2585135 RepID=A0ABX5VU27_9MICO|nr:MULTISPECIES: type II toxin-antitoxin system VapC family toxin [Georgenia]QDB80560.1 type II toxin-antitoxin system VapC family toxin [Georgenia wutianyii]TNC18229.1 type II toxin-antitoxin system VapC family toxin [Georgenia sp. 311]